MHARSAPGYLRFAILALCIGIADRLQGFDQPAGERAPRGVLSGRIVDEAGEPVTDARIEIWPERGGIILNANGDPDGRYYFLTVKSAGDYRIKITSRQCVGITKYEELPRVGLKAGANQVRNFTLKAACRMRLQIVDEQGNPLSGVQVYHKLSTDKQYASGESSSTDKLGWALLGGMEPSTAKRLFAAYHESYAIAQFSFTLNDPRSVAEEKIVLLKGEKVKGTVLCSDGKPAAGWTLYAKPANWQFGVYLNPSKIGPDGSFEFSGIVPGEYDLIMLVPTGKSSSTSKPVGSGVTLPPADGALALRVDYPSPASMANITGKIAFEKGKPPNWISVSAQSNDTDNWLYFNIQTDKPDFELGPLPRGVYTLRFESPEIESKTLKKVAVPSDHLDVKIAIRKNPLLQGNVVRADTKQPVSEFRARVNRLQVLSEQGYVHDDTWHEVKDKAGAFSLEVVGSGIYTVQIAADGLAPVTSEKINTNTDGNRRLNLELGPGTSLSGMVVDDEGRRVDGVRVELLSMRPTSRSVEKTDLPASSAVETDLGKFTFEHLPAGPDTLKASHPDYCFSLEKISPGANPPGEPLRIVMKRGGTVRGEVYNELGQPKPNVSVYFHREGSGGGVNDNERLSMAVTDDNGHYEVRHLPAQICSVTRSDEWTEFGVVRHSILPAEGKTRTLDLGGPTRLRGRLVINGKAVPDAQLFLSGDAPFSTLFRARGRTDKEGAFAFRGVPVGERTLYYSKSANQLQMARVKTLKLSANGADLGTIETRLVNLAVRCEPLDEASAEKLLITLELYNSIWARGATAGSLRKRTQPAQPFVIEGVPPGRYELVCTPANHFSVRHVIDVADSDAEQTTIVAIPQGTASLSGRFDNSIQSDQGNPEALVWSKNRQLFNIIRPKEDGTYRLENIPAGEYFLTRENLRDPEALTTFSLDEGENKSLDLTSELLASKRPPRSFATMRVFTSEGVPLPGCEIHFQGSGEKPILDSSQDGRMVFSGPTGTYPMTVTYPGLEPIEQTLELKPLEQDAMPMRPEVYLYLRASDP